MKAMMVATFVMALLAPTLAAAQPSPPSWECHTSKGSERSCRAIWDNRDRAPPPMIEND